MKSTLRSYSTIRGLMAAGTLLIGSQLAGQTFITFQAPNAQNTYPWGINDGGTVAGDYVDSSNIYHGFLRYSDGSIVTFDAGSDPRLGTYVSGINAAGTVVGMYYGVRNTGPFVRAANGTITFIRIPGSTNTYLGGINSAGDLTGAYTDASNHQHGFLLTRDGTFTSFDVPGTISNTVGIAINDSDEIAGYYFNGSNKFIGFVRSATGSFATFAGTPTSINNSGAVAGQIANGNIENDCGFVRDPDGTITHFGGRGTQVRSIDSTGTVAGVILYQDIDVGLIRSSGGESQRFEVPGAVAGPDQLGTIATSIRSVVTGYYNNGENLAGFLLIP